MLEGEAIIAVGRWRGRPTVLPHGIIAVPGPCLVVATCYAASPVGPFLELVVAQPARLGLRLGWCVSCAVADSPDARRGARLNWGLPHQLGTLVWTSDGDGRELRWVERDFVVRGRRDDPVVPWLVPMRMLQHRRDGDVVVPGRLRGRGRLATVNVEVGSGLGADDALTGLAGERRGLIVGSLRYRLAPARRPLGATATLVAPLRAPEPVVAGPLRALTPRRERLPIPRLVASLPR